MNCRNGDCSNMGKRYIFGLGHTRQLTVLCDDCAAKLSAIGMNLRSEDRSAERDTRPAWLRNLKPRDMTGSIA